MEEISIGADGDRPGAIQAVYATRTVSYYFNKGQAANGIMAGKDHYWKN